MQAIPPVMAIDLWHIFPLREEVISIYQTGVSRFFSPFSNIRVVQNLLTGNVGRLTLFVRVLITLKMCV